MTACFMFSLTSFCFSRLEMGFQNATENAEYLFLNNFL